MKISVLMPCYNAQKYIHRSIDSVLTQSFSEFEFIIIDDGSNDDTVSIIRTYKDKRIKLICLDANTGIANALNIGLKACKGKYIARMDSDDICLNERLAQQNDYLDNHSSIVAVGSAVINFNEVGDQVKISYPTDHLSILLNIFLFERTICHPSVMFRANVMNVGVKYQEHRLWCEDLDLWFQLSKVGRLANIERPLLKYFRDSSQSSVKHKSVMQKQTKNLLYNIWQTYKVDNINQVVNYIMGELDINTQQIKLIHASIKRCISSNTSIKIEQINETLAFKRLRLNYRYNGGIIKLLFYLMIYLKSIKQGRFKKLVSLRMLRKIERLKHSAV